MSDDFTDTKGVPQRRRSSDLRLSDLEMELTVLKKIQEEQASELALNTKITMEIREILELGKTFFKMLGVIGKMLKWVAMVGGSCGAIWAAWKTGHWPSN